MRARDGASIVVVVAVWLGVSALAHAEAPRAATADARGCWTLGRYGDVTLTADRHARIRASDGLRAGRASSYRAEVTERGDGTLVFACGPRTQHGLVCVATPGATSLDVAIYARGHGATSRLRFVEIVQATSCPR